MKKPSDNSLTWKLLLIPVIATFGFGAYLIYSTSVLTDGNSLFQDIRDSDFPILEAAGKSLNSYESVVEALHTAAATGELEFLNAATVKASEIQQRYAMLEKLDAEHKDEVEKLKTGFDTYFALALDISRQMANQSGSPSLQQIAKMRAARNAYLSGLAAYRDAAEKDFHATVGEAISKSERAKIWGRAIGICMLLFILVLTFLVIREIAQRKRLEQEIHNLAFYDPLTTLPNRRLFLDRCQAALTASARSNDYGAVLFIDLDRFKSLNDTLGHEYGDLLLTEVGVRIMASIRERDTVARFGGDEFVVLIEAISNQHDDATHKVALVAEKIRVALAHPYQLKEHEHHSSPSIGVSLYHGNDESQTTLLEQADMAMYQAKKSGRNAVRIFDSTMQKA